MAEKKKADKMAKEVAQEMTPDEAKAFRASLYKPEVRKLTEQECREQFRLFWAKNKKSYGKTKELEQIVWVHLKSSGFIEPGQFEAGIKHFGLKKIGN